MPPAREHKPPLPLARGPLPPHPTRLTHYHHHHSTHTPPPPHTHTCCCCCRLLITPIMLQLPFCLLLPTLPLLAAVNLTRMPAICAAAYAHQPPGACVWRGISRVAARGVALPLTVVAVAELLARRVYLSSMAAAATATGAAASPPPSARAAGVLAPAAAAPTLAGGGQQQPASAVAVGPSTLQGQPAHARAGHQAAAGRGCVIQ